MSYLKFGIIDYSKVYILLCSGNNMSIDYQNKDREKLLKLRDNAVKKGDNVAYFKICSALGEYLPDFLRNFCIGEQISELEETLDEYCVIADENMEQNSAKTIYKILEAGCYLEDYYNVVKDVLKKKGIKRIPVGKGKDEVLLSNAKKGQIVRYAERLLIKNKFPTAP